MLETKTKTKRKRSNSPAPPNVETVSMANVLTLVEAAAYLRVSELDLLNLLRQQDLPGRQIGQEWRILRTALDHWLSTPCSRDRLRCREG